MCGFLNSLLLLLLHVVLAVRDNQAPQVWSVDAHAHLANFFDDEVITKPSMSVEEQTAEKEFLDIIRGQSKNTHQQKIAEALEKAKYDSSSFKSVFRDLSFVDKHELVLRSIRVLEGEGHTVESTKLANKMKMIAADCANIKTAQWTESNQTHPGFSHLKRLRMQDVKGNAAEVTQSVEVPTAAKKLDSIQVFEGADHTVRSKKLADVMKIARADIKTAQRTEFDQTQPGFPKLGRLSMQEVSDNTDFVIHSIEVPGAKDEIEAFLKNLHTRPTLDRQFVVKHYVGKGQFGLVLKALFNDSSEVALKLLAFPRRAHVASKEWYVSKHLRKNEVRNVVLTHEHVYLSSTGNFIGLVQPFMGSFTTLDKFDPQGKPTGTMVHVMKQAASVLANMHAKLTQHGDIKPDNIMVNERVPFDVHLIDLGNAHIGRKAENIRYDVLRFGWTLFCVVTSHDWDVKTFQKRQPADFIRLLGSQRAYQNLLQNILQEEDWSMEAVVGDLSRM